MENTSKCVFDSVIFIYSIIVHNNRTSAHKQSGKRCRADLHVRTKSKRYVGLSAVNLIVCLLKQMKATLIPNDNKHACTMRLILFCIELQRPIRNWICRSWTRVFLCAHNKMYKKEECVNGMLSNVLAAQWTCTRFTRRGCFFVLDVYPAFALIYWQNRFLWPSNSHECKLAFSSLGNEMAFFRGKVKEKRIK